MLLFINYTKTKLNEKLAYFAKRVGGLRSGDGT